MTGSSQQRWNRVSYSKFAGIDLIKDLYTTSERAEPWRGAPNSTIISNAFGLALPEDKSISRPGGIESKEHSKTGYIPISDTALYRRGKLPAIHRNVSYGLYPPSDSQRGPRLRQIF
ncbi:hypothetical protein DTO282F9_88 [Paecilomyces variotii]|nr:hypothetical protein DTO282F9_88 [Paecilomyces variotii]